ncbi:MAG: 30S ribosomal protein S12 methylthiotransferase RimO [Endomicrobia bacterium]|nr:30S ribosomal protein S12 methylthiotransferase RimO [Endomicrobiia bacterium]
MQKVAVIVLGCPKNTVEAEYLLGILKNKGFYLTGDINDADAVVIHTCSFIHDARVESEKCIKNVLSLKSKKDIKLYVTGCLPQLLKEKITEKFPLIDGYTGTGALDRLPLLLLDKKADNPLKPGGLNDSKHRILSSPLPSAYLKISEGCNHRCSFCIIPDLRGKFTSRTIESLYNEAKSLARAGVKELILIAQDTTTYGLDLYGAFALDKLLSKLAKINDFKWIRLMYAYPSSITDSLLDVFKEYKNICNYIDIPVQHVSKNVLSAMKRPLNTAKIIEKIVNKIPGIVLRTSIITGFPGETGKDVKELIDFIKNGYFQYAGVFEYSDQKEVASSKLKSRVSQETAKQRRVEIEKAQYDVFKTKIDVLKNKETEFFAESCVKKGKKYLVTGRSAFQAPDIDGCTEILSKKALECGGFYKVIIKNNEGYKIKTEAAG